MKAKLIKLEPIASKEERKIKEKEAKDKISAAVDFVNNLENKKRTTSFRVTEWRQDSNSKAVYSGKKETENTPHKYSNRKIEGFNLQHQYQDEVSNSRV